MTYSHIKFINKEIKHKILLQKYLLYKKNIIKNNDFIIRMHFIYSYYS